MQLVIGTKNWSTWSMRPWLVLKRLAVSFDEIRIPLRQDDTPDLIAPHSPSGKVPCLIDGDLRVWDSLAICEFLAERYPAAWPADAATRAIARSATAEMHSGFASLRNECPMDLGLREDKDLSEATQKDVRRLIALWRDLRGRFGADGPFLCGAWSIADAFYTPTATRLRTYGVDLAALGDDGVAAAYVDTLLSQPEFAEWEAAARASA